jgi:uncharacterized damage-inducible protein DinB
LADTDPSPPRARPAPGKAGTLTLLPDNPSWTRALTEHAAALDTFIARIEAIPDTAWHRERAPGKWSPAALALHVIDSYRLGHDAIRSGGGGMRLRVAPWQAWIGRTIYFPAMLALGRFPQGAPAPSEVRPDLEAAARLDRAEAIATLRRVAEAAVTALVAAPPSTRFVHAYFGGMSPRLTLRLLGAHTRHHAAGMVAVGSVGS